jgi:hypothetical protein
MDELRKGHCLSIKVQPNDPRSPLLGVKADHCWLHRKVGFFEKSSAPTMLHPLVQMPLHIVRVAWHSNQSVSANESGEQALENRLATNLERFRLHQKHANNRFNA